MASPPTLEHVFAHAQFSQDGVAGCLSQCRRCSCSSLVPLEPTKGQWMLHLGPHGQLGTVKGSFCDDIACNCIGASMSMCCAVMGLIKTRSEETGMITVGWQHVHSKRLLVPQRQRHQRLWTSWTAWHCEGFWNFKKKEATQGYVAALHDTNVVQRQRHQEKKMSVLP